MTPQPSANTQQRPAAAPRDGDAGAALSRAPFDASALFVGMRLFIKPRSTTSNAKYQTSLIGWDQGQALIVRIPLDGIVPMSIVAGETVDVRLFTGRAALLFAAEVERVQRSPFPHLILSYPSTAFVAALRSADRAAVDLAAELQPPTSANANAGATLRVRVRDLSTGGALIEHDDAIPVRVGDKVTLKLDLSTASGRRRAVEAKAAVRSLRTPSDASSTTFQTGLQFDPLSEIDELMVECTTQAARLKAGMRGR